MRIIIRVLIQSITYHLAVEREIYSSTECNSWHEHRGPRVGWLIIAVSVISLNSGHVLEKIVVRVKLKQFYSFDKKTGVQESNGGRYEVKVDSQAPRR